MIDLDLIRKREAWVRKNTHEDGLAVYDDRRALLAYVDELKRDAERYRWLESQARQNTAYDIYGNGGCWSIGFFSSDNRKPVGEAIDAVMGKK
jgi:hypothetical protein